MAYFAFNFDNFKKVANLFGNHRPPQIVNTLQFVWHALRGFQTMLLPYEPLWLVLFITARCSLRCLPCPYRSPETPRQPHSFRDMTMESFRQILDRFPRATSIALTGGEPLAHPQVFEMIHLAHARRLKVHIPTNGTLMGRKLEALLQAPVELLNVSMYGTDARSFSQVTGADGSLFNAVLEGLAELARRRRAGGYPRIIRTSFILTKNNLQQAVDFIRLSEKIGVDQVKLKSLRFYGIPGLEESMCPHRDDPEVQELIETLRRQRFRIPVFLPRIHRHNYLQRCDMPFRLLTIDGDGFIGPCCIEGTDKRWDNFFDQPDVWNGPTMTRARRDMMDQACPLPPLCLSCEERIPERPTLDD